jgi:hypothetical protein
MLQSATPAAGYAVRCGYLSAATRRYACFDIHSRCMQAWQRCGSAYMKRCVMWPPCRCLQLQLVLSCQSTSPQLLSHRPACAPQHQSLAASCITTSRTSCSPPTSRQQLQEQAQMPHLHRRLLLPSCQATASPSALSSAAQQPLTASQQQLTRCARTTQTLPARLTQQQA